MRNVSMKHFLSRSEVRILIILQQIRPYIQCVRRVNLEATRLKYLNQNHFRLSSNSSTTHREHRRKSYERKRQANHQQYNKTSTDHESGISPQLNHYQRLNVNFDADLETIKAAYYALTKVYHPDASLSNDESAIENFRLITESYDTLSSPSARAEYDRQLGVELDTAKITEFYAASGSGIEPTSLYRSKSADIFFKERNDAILQRERLKNPRKFRAGSFVDDGNIDRESASERIAMMRRISNIPKNSQEGLYTEHLRESARRRIRGWEEQPYQEDTPEPSWLPLTTIFGTLVIVGYCIANIVFDIDIADKLDHQLEARIAANKESISEPEA